MSVERLNDYRLKKNKNVDRELKWNWMQLRMQLCQKIQIKICRATRILTILAIYHGHN